MFELMNRTFNPFREMAEFEKNAFGGFFGDHALAEFKTDISDEGDHFLLEADLPGFEKMDIDLSLTGDTLTVRAQRHSKYEDKDQQQKLVRMERSYGSYSRQYDMTGIDVSGIRAQYQDGVLRLYLPKQQEQLPESRKLEIE